MRIGALVALATALLATPARAEDPGAEVGSIAAPKASARTRLTMPPRTVRDAPAPDSGTPAPGKAGCLEERDLAIDPANHPVDRPLHLGMQSYPQTLALRDREVVLTFDDGPSPDTTPQILTALRNACVHANFFLIGRETRRYPELARQEMEEGHTVGHHSDTHPSFTLRGFDEVSAETDLQNGIASDEVSAETDLQNGIASDEAAIYGADAKPNEPHVPFFRFPGFADTPALLNDLDRRGIAVFGSDLWAADWLMMTPDHELKRVIALLEGRPRRNGIILFHDTRRSTAAMLPDFLRELRARGYRVVHLTYRKGAAMPALTKPLKGTPETVKIIAHLRTPIVPGAHRLGDVGDTPQSSGGGAMGEGQP